MTLDENMQVTVKSLWSIGVMINYIFIMKTYIYMTKMKNKFVTKEPNNTKRYCEQQVSEKSQRFRLFKNQWNQNMWPVTWHWALKQQTNDQRSFPLGTSTTITGSLNFNVDQRQEHKIKLASMSLLPCACWEGFPNTPTCNHMISTKPIVWMLTIASTLLLLPSSRMNTATLKLLTEVSGISSARQQAIPATAQASPCKQGSALTCSCRSLATSSFFLCSSSRLCSSSISILRASFSPASRSYSCRSRARRSVDSSKASATVEEWMPSERVRWQMVKATGTLSYTTWQSFE